MKKFYCIFETWQEGRILVDPPFQLIEMGDWRNIKTNQTIDSEIYYSLWKNLNASEIARFQSEHRQSWVIACCAQAQNQDDLLDQMKKNIPDIVIKGLVEITQSNAKTIDLFFQPEQRV